MTATIDQPTFDIFEPPPRVSIQDAERDCGRCERHVTGYQAWSSDHAPVRGARVNGAPECMAMMLTLNHVIYQLREIASPDPEFHTTSSNCETCLRRRKPLPRVHTVEYNLRRFTYYWDRVHEVWPESRHADLDAYIRAHGRLIGAWELITGDEVPA